MQVKHTKTTSMKTLPSLIAILTGFVTVWTFLTHPLEKRQDAIEQAQKEATQALAEKAAKVEAETTAIRDAFGAKIEQVYARVSDSREAIARIEAKQDALQRQLDSVYRQMKTVSDSTRTVPSPLSRGYAATEKPPR